MERFNNDEIDADTSSKIEKQILTDEIDDPEFLEFAIENLDELFSYIINGNLNIRIHGNITGPPKDASGKPAPVRTAWPGGRRAADCVTIVIPNLPA